HFLVKCVGGAFAPHFFKTVENKNHMMTFSERKGLANVSETLQIDSMSRELRNLLWNIVYVSFLGRGNDRAVMEFSVAISGVEAMAKIIAGSATATLADALKQLE